MMKTPNSTDKIASQTQRYVHPDLPVFKGHFPGMPLVPAALLLEWMLESLPNGKDENTAWTVMQAKFTKAVQPGDTINIIASGDESCTSVRMIGKDGNVHATAKFRRDK